MKYIKQYEVTFGEDYNFDNYLLIKTFCDFLYNFIGEALKLYNQYCYIGVNHYRDKGYLTYYFSFKEHKKFEQTYQIFQISDLDNYFNFKIDEYLLTRITNELADILLFIYEIIEQYDDEKQFGQPIKDIPEITSKITLDNLELYLSANKYNL